MNRVVLTACLVALSSASFIVTAASSAPSPGDKPEPHRFEPFTPESVTSNSSVTIEGKSISYQAVAGTFVIHPKDWDDVPRDPAGEKPGADDGEAGAHPRKGRSEDYNASFSIANPARPGA